MKKKYCIAVAGTGYVGMSIAVLLAQRNKVVAVDIVPEKVALINEKKLRFRMNIERFKRKKFGSIYYPGCV